MSTYSEALGYTRAGDKSQTCNACGQTFTVRPRGFAVEGSVLRSHRRHCPVNPHEVYEPASTGRDPDAIYDASGKKIGRSAFSTKGYDLW